MKVLFLSFYFPPDLSAGSFRMGGIYEFLKINQSSFESIDIITSMPNRYKSFKVESPVFEVNGNINIYRLSLPNHKNGLVDQIFSFLSFFKQAISITNKNEYDLVFATSSRLFTAFLGAVISRRKKALLFLDIRDLFVDTLKSVLNRKIFPLLKPIIKQIKRYTFKRAHHINFVSEGFKPYIENNYPFVKNMSFITNGIDQEFIDYEYSKLKNNNGIIITYAGNIGEGQGLHKLFPQVAEMLPHINFRMVGDGGKKELLKNRINGLNNVLLISPVDRNKLKLLYKESDILMLQLNSYEAFEKVLPSKIFEYAVTKKKILAGIKGYSKKFMETNVKNVEFFEPCDPESFVVAFHKIQKRPLEENYSVEQFRRDILTDKLMKKMISIVE